MRCTSREQSSHTSRVLRCTVNSPHWVPGTGGNLGICLDSVGLARAVALFSNPEEDKLSMLTFQNIQIFAGLHLLL